MPTADDSMKPRSVMTVAAIEVLVVLLVDLLYVYVDPRIRYGTD